jgi:hypothetical protein
VCPDYGLNVYLDKCVVMKISQKTGGKEKKYNYEIKEAESFKDMGSKIVTNGSVKRRNYRKNKYVEKFYQLVKDIIWKFQMPKKRKICPFKKLLHAHINICSNFDMHKGRY